MAHHTALDFLSMDAFQFDHQGAATTSDNKEHVANPFGYDFCNFLNDSDNSSRINDDGQQLLTQTEDQDLNNFFTTTNFNDPHALSDLPDTVDNSAYDFLNEQFMAPATVHQISSIPANQMQLQQDVKFQQQTFMPQHMHSQHMSTHSQEDLQAASTLFNNAQQHPGVNGRSLSFHEATSPQASQPSNYTGRAMVATSNGLLHEQIAALVPNHHQPGSMDAHFARHWAIAQPLKQHEAEYSPMYQKTHLKPSIAFGTDKSFSSTLGFAAPHGIQESQEQEVEKYIHHLMQPHGQTQGANGTGLRSPVTTPRSDGISEDSSSTQGAGRSAKRQKQNAHRVSKSSPRKGTKGGKIRKGSVAEEAKKKRAVQKVQRENLTDEQKRSNHIMSEQKRRNLIKQGFKDLNGLVPEVRDSGVSKSIVLTEAANFLEKILQDNKLFRQGVPT